MARRAANANVAHHAVRHQDGKGAHHTLEEKLEQDRKHGIGGPRKGDRSHSPSPPVEVYEEPEVVPPKVITTADRVQGIHDMSLSVETTAEPAKTAATNLFAFKKGASRAILEHVRQKDRTVWAVIYLHPAFENSAIVLIVLNAIWIGIDVDMNRPDDRQIPKEFFEVGEIIFCILFTLELMVRFLAYKHKEQFFKDPDMKNWNIFDTILVTSMFADTVVLTYVLKADANQLRFMSTLRLVRLLRITRIFRLLPELGMMVKSLLAAVRSVASTCLLGFGVMYIFAILVTQWAKSYGSKGKCVGDPGYEICLNDFFGSMKESFLTLFQFLEFDDTFEVLKPIFREDVLIGLLLVCYMLLCSFTILNMLIGIICDIVDEATEKEKKKLLHQKLQAIFSSLDSGDRNAITREEFSTNRSKHLLRHAGLTESFVKNFENAFDILDSNRDGELERDEFIRMIFKCLNEPHSEDVLELEAKIDKVTRALGLTHDKIAVTEKERRMSNSMDVTHAASTASALADRSGPGGTQSKKKEVKRYVQLRAEREKWMNQRLKVLSKSLGNVLLLAGSGRLSDNTDVLTDEPGAFVTGQTWLQPFQTQAYRNADAISRMVPPAMPSTGLMTIIRPAMRALHARLHALRAECKAFGMRYAGNIAGAEGQDLIPRESLMPLDELISEVLGRLDAAGRSLRLTGFTVALPRAEPRQRNVLEQKEDNAILALEN